MPVEQSQDVQSLFSGSNVKYHKKLLHFVMYVMYVGRPFPRATNKVASFNPLSEKGVKLVFYCTNTCHSSGASMIGLTYLWLKQRFQTRSHNLMWLLDLQMGSFEKTSSFDLFIYFAT